MSDVALFLRDVDDRRAYTLPGVASSHLFRFVDRKLSTNETNSIATEKCAMDVDDVRSFVRR